jgi:hypothetical protein
MRGDLCARRYCATPLVIGTDGNGKLLSDCPSCERNKRGLCRDCPAPLQIVAATGKPSPKAMRCQRCALAWLAAKKKRAYHADPAKYRLQRRQSSKRPHVREREKRWRAEWLKHRPRTTRDELDKLYHRAWRAKHFSDPRNRAHRNAVRRRWVAANREHVNACQRRRNAQRRDQINAAQSQRRAEKRSAA